MNIAVEKKLNTSLSYNTFIHSSMLCRANRYALHRRRRLLLVLLISISISFLLIRLKTQENISFSSTIIDQTIILIRTSHYCQLRLDYLRQSWIPTSFSEQSNIYILTDNISKYSNKILLNSFKNIIEANCSETHNRFDLCCKTAHEFELFYNLSQKNSNLRWMCRFDDDQYVNLNNLYTLLSKIDSSKPYYVGRRGKYFRSKIPRQNRTYLFATYGAGVCFSRPLLEKLRPYVNKTIFPYGCINGTVSDDGYVGYFIGLILNISLFSLNDLFHSHLEQLDNSFRLFNIEYLQKSITFGFSWDRYTVSWLPIIHRLLELINKGEKNIANTLWIFLQNYEKQHPENLTNKYDRTCSSYGRKKLN